MLELLKSDQTVLIVTISFFKRKKKKLLLLVGLSHRGIITYCGNKGILEEESEMKTG